MKLGPKLLAVPLLSAIVALATGAGLLWLSERSAARAEAVAQNRFETLRTLGDAREQLVGVRGDVFRGLALMASLSDAEVKALRTSLATQVDGVVRVVATVGDGSDAGLTAKIQDVSTQLALFAKQADKAIDLSTMEPTVGIGAMKAAEDTYGKVSTGFSEMLQISEAAQDQIVATALKQKQQATIGVAMLALLVIAAGLALAWRLQRRVTGDLAEAVAHAGRVADGHLDPTAPSERRDEIGDLQRALSNMTTRLRDSLLAVRRSAESIGTASAEIAAGNADLSHRTESAASNLQQTAASVEQLSGAVRQSASAASNANALAHTAAQAAHRGGEVVSQVVGTMDEINASSRKIADIISVIDGIAFQTNILALNAAVEAARAGEQGRGFAVVASEVRSLAKRSADAAREIKDLIDTSVEKVSVGTRLVGDAGTSMQDIVTGVQRVNAVISEISVAASEQASGVGQVNSAVSALDQMTQQNAALVEQSAAAAESLRTQAERLNEVIAGFRLGT